MNIISKIFGKSQTSSHKIPEGFFEVPVFTFIFGTAVCSDDMCPCSNTAISRGEGFMYISEEVVKNRIKAPSHEKAIELMGKWDREKAWRLGSKGYSPTSGYKDIIYPILACEIGAKRRNINLDIAAADAKHWWETGLLPLINAIHLAD